MKPFTRFSFLLLSAVHLLSAEEPKPVHPFEPAELLLALPSTPDQWTLVRSDAELSLGRSLFSKATRIFQAPPSPADATGNAPPPPGEVRIAVVDTGGDAPSLADFADFQPVRIGTFEKKLIASLPAIIQSDDHGRQTAQILVAARYLVEITLTHLPRQRVEDWLRTFHFDQLPPKSDTPSTDSHAFLLTHIDELHPERNRTYTVLTTDPKALPKDDSTR